MRVSGILLQENPDKTMASFSDFYKISYKYDFCYQSEEKTN